MNLTTQVFEYDVLRIGVITNGVCFEQRHFNYLAQFSPSKYFQLHHQGIRFLNYVGVIQALDLTIEILPKIDKTLSTPNNWRDILIDMLRYCRLLNVDSLGDAKLKWKKHSILDLYYELFLIEVEQIVHRGQYRSYRKITENQKSFKGRLAFEPHMRHNWLHKERFYISYDTYDSNNIFNQIIATTLQLLGKANLSSYLRTKLKTLQIEFLDHSTYRFQRSDFESLVFNRQNAHYKKAIQIARLLLLQNRPSISSGRNQLIALLFDMNLLFEEYIFRQLSRLHHRDIGVSRQQQKEFWNRQHIRPDIVLRKEDKRYVIDTKWKILPRSKPSVSDLQQAFVYGQYFDAPTTVLLYPGNGGTKNVAPKSFQLPVYRGDYKCGLFFAEVVKEGKLNLSIGEEIVEYLARAEVR